MSSPSISPWADMALGCRRLEGLRPEMNLPDHQLKLLQIRPYFMPPGWQVPVHEHSFYEASIILSGAARPSFPEDSTLAAGDIYYHGPHSAHSWSAPAEPCHRLILWFTVEPAVAMPPPAQWPRSDRILEDCLALLEALIAPKPGWRDTATARLGTILSQILALGSLPSTTAELHSPQGLAESVDIFLRDNLHRSLQLPYVARCLGVSQSSLTHRYRAETGISVGQRLLDLRMGEAARLLSTTDLTLETIAGRIGLTDAAYLCRLFKRYFNYSPGHYRHTAGARNPAHS